MQNFTPDHFPIIQGALKGSPKRRLGFDNSLSILSGAMHCDDESPDTDRQTSPPQPLRKAAYEEIKKVFSTAVDTAWELTVCRPYFYAGKYKEVTPQVLALYESININALHSVVGAHKKVLKAMKEPGCPALEDSPVLSAIHAVLTEASSLAVEMSLQKAYLVSGRAEPTREEMAIRKSRENPDKVVKTCACCFRPIALAGHTMAHHGYQRPGDGVQTSSCPGIDFKPLEVSSEGLAWLLKVHETSLNQLELEYSRKHLLVALAKPKTSAPLVDKSQAPLRIHKNDPLWEATFAAYVYRLESKIRHGHETVRMLSEKLSNWVASEPEDLCSQPKTNGAKPR